MRLHLKAVALAVFIYLLIIIYYIWFSKDWKPLKPLPPKKRPPLPFDPCKTPGHGKPQNISIPPHVKLCDGCREIIMKMQEYYPCWKKNKDSYQKFRSQLINKCHGMEKAIVTQANTPLGSKLTYDGEKKKTFQVPEDFFKIFPKEHPFQNKTWDTCSVVGNGGILLNSNCGKKIDSAQVVIRCNLPPVGKDYAKDVGNKTDIVTANPSILIEKFGSLMGRRRPFVEALRSYGKSLLLLPAFSFNPNTYVCQRAVYTIEESESPIRPVFFNPDYLQSLGLFWSSQNLKAQRVSSGLIMASLALELCDNVDLYGFWPFSNHPEDFHALTNHYYDDSPAKKIFHAMPGEFNHLLQMHNDGVLRLHLGDCR